MPSAGFEPAIPVTKRPQTYALDRVGTGIDCVFKLLLLLLLLLLFTGAYSPGRTFGLPFRGFCDLTHTRIQAHGRTPQDE
jgi:hypothetical protein